MFHKPIDDPAAHGEALLTTICMSHKTSGIKWQLGAANISERCKHAAMCCNLFVAVREVREPAC